MAKPDPARLDAAARTPFNRTVEPHFGDLDTAMRINTAALVRILADGRVRFRARNSYHGAMGELVSTVASFNVEDLGQSVSHGIVRP